MSVPAESTNDLKTEILEQAIHTAVHGQIEDLETLRPQLTIHDLREILKADNIELTVRALLFEGFFWNHTYENAANLPALLLKTAIQRFHPPKDQPAIVPSLTQLFEQAKELPPSTAYWAAACSIHDVLDKIFPTELPNRNAVTIETLRTLQLASGEVDMRVLRELELQGEVINQELFGTYVAPEVFRIACLCGDINVVKRLRPLLDPNQPLPNYAMALACLAQHADVVEYLIKENFPSTLALHFALQAENENLAKRVLNISNVNEKDWYGRTALVIAMRQSNVEALIPMIVERCSLETLAVKTPGRDGFDVLEYACKKDQLALVQQILAKDLKPSLQEARRYYQLTTNTEIEALLKAIYDERCNANQESLKDQDPPVSADRSFSEKYEYPASDPAPYQTYIFTEALQYALAKNDQPKIQEYQAILRRIYYEALLLALSNNRIDPFTRAAQCGLLPELKAEWPANLAPGDKSLNLALGDAARHGHLHIVKYLIAHGAQPGYINVIELCKDGQYDIQKLLLETWPNLNVTGGLQAALDRYQRKMFSLVLPYTKDEDLDNASYGKGSTALAIACEQRSQESVKDLLKRGADPNKTSVGLGGEDIVTPLSVASRLGFGDVVSYLLADKRTTFDFRDERGRSAIHNAAECGDLGIFKQLLPHYQQSLEASDWDYFIIAADKKNQHPVHKAQFIQHLVDTYQGPLSPEAIATVAKAIPGFTRESTVKAPEVAPPPVLAPVQAETGNAASKPKASELVPPPPAVDTTPALTPTAQEQPVIKKSLPKQFLHDARYGLMHDWVKSHLKSQSSLFEINRLKHKLMENAVLQLSTKNLDGAPLSTILTTPLKLEFAEKPTDKQIAMLKTKHNLDITQPVTLLQLSQLQRNPWSHGLTKTTQHLLSKISKDLSTRDKFVLYLEIEKARLTADKKLDTKTRDKLDYINEAISLLQRKSEESKDYTLSVLLNTVVSYTSRFGINQPKMVHALEMHRGRHFFGTTTSMSDLKLVFGDREVEHAAKVRSAERDNRFLLD